MSTTSISVTKAEAVSILRTQIAKAKLHDKAAAAQHKIDEAEYFARFKQACKDATRWTYAEAKANYFDPMCLKAARQRDYDGNPKAAPQCPVSQARWLQGELDRVELSSQRIYKAGPDTTLHKALLWDPTPVASICD